MLGLKASVASEVSKSKLYFEHSYDIDAEYKLRSHVLTFVVIVFTLISKSFRDQLIHQSRDR